MPEPPAKVRLLIDGQPVEVAKGTSVAAAVLASDRTSFRRSVKGEPRGPICGMGICFECRLTIDGQTQRRSCLVTCRSGMEVVTG